jgi:hypothetical protein
MNDEYMQLIEDCENREDRLSDWERGFIDSVRRQIEGGGALSEKQAEKLNDVWEQATAKG